MAQLTNTPRSETNLRLEARKSFSFNLKVVDGDSRPVDLSDTTLELSVGTALRAAADLGVAASAGYARFDLQAADLDLPAAEHPYSISIVDDGYSAVLVRGTIEIVDSPGDTGLNSTYTGGQAVSTLEASLQGSVIVVQAGDVRLPDVDVFTDRDRTKLDGIEAGAEKNVQADWNAGPATPGYIRNRPLARLVPKPAAANQVLTSNSTGGYSWAQLQGSGAELELGAEGAQAGAVPTANGAGLWGWERHDPPVTSVNGQTGAVSLDADDIAETTTHVVMTTEERAKLAAVEPLNRVSWENVSGKPEVGTGAALSKEQIVQTGQGKASDIREGVLDKDRLPRVTELRGFTYGTAAPTGGSDGDLYFQHG